MAPGVCNIAADPPTPQTVGAAKLTPEGGAAVPSERCWGLTAGVVLREGRGPAPRVETRPNPHEVGGKGTTCQGGGRRPEVRNGTARLAAAVGMQAEGCGGGTTPKRQRPLTADERGTAPAYPCARVCCGAGQEAPEGYESKDVSRGTSFGNPVALPFGTHNRTAYGTAVEAFDAICEHVTENAMGGALPRGLVTQTDRIHQHQLEVTQRELDNALWRTAWSVSRDGANYALKCRCHGVTLA